MTPSSSMATLDGGVVVVGSMDGELTLMKLTVGGETDASFGESGRVTVKGAQVWDQYGIGLAQQPDGKIIAGVATYTSYPTVWKFMLMRVNADGTFDATFGSNGVAFPPFAQQFFSRRILVQSDGTLLIAANIPQGSCVARLLADGSLDTSYGIQGYAFESPIYQGGEEGQTPDMWQQPDGKILINSNSWITRFLTTGAIDTGFGANGQLYMGPWGGSWLNDFVLLQNGQILVPNPYYDWSYAYSGDGHSYLVSLLPPTGRYALLASGKIVTPGGTIFDPGTGTSKKVSLPYSFAGEQDVTAEPGGGFLITLKPYESGPMRVARFDADGNSVATFGQGGAISLQFADVEDSSATQVLGELVLHQPTTGEALNTGWAASAGYFLLDKAGRPSSPQKIAMPDAVLSILPEGDILAFNGLGIQMYSLYSLAYHWQVAYVPASFNTQCVQAYGPIVQGYPIVEPYGPSWTGVAPSYFLAGAETVKSRSLAALRLFSLSHPVKLLTLPGYTRTLTLIPDRVGGWYVVVANDANAQAVAHVTADVVLDKTFGSAGLLAMGKGQSLVGRQCVSPLGDGRMALVSSQKAVPFHSLQLFTAKGRLASSIPLPDLDAGMVQLQAGPDGRLVAAGPTAQGFAVHRLTLQDTIDASFGGEVSNGHGHADSVWSVSQSDSGEWWVTGGTRPQVATYPFVAKIKPDPQTVSALDGYDPVTLDRNTGLMEQTVCLYNHSTKDAPAARLRVTHLPAGVQVWHAPKEGGLASWLVPVPAMAAGTQTEIPIHYYIPSHRPLIFQPTLQIVSSTF